MSPNIYVVVLLSFFNFGEERWGGERGREHPLLKILLLQNV